MDGEYEMGVFYKTSSKERTNERPQVFISSALVYLLEIKRNFRRNTKRGRRFADLRPSSSSANEEDEEKSEAIVRWSEGAQGEVTWLPHPSARGRPEPVIVHVQEAG